MHQLLCSSCSCVLFFFNDTATTEIYTLSLHDALPIYTRSSPSAAALRWSWPCALPIRSEEHTSELQSPMYLVCRLLLEKKKQTECKVLDSRRQAQPTSYKCAARLS